MSYFQLYIIITLFSYALSMWSVITLHNYGVIKLDTAFKTYSRGFVISLIPIVAQIHALFTFAIATYLAFDKETREKLIIFMKERFGND